MRMIIEAHLVDDEGCTERVQVYAIDRELTTDPLGMSLAEGKALLAAAQQLLKSANSASHVNERC